jgi:hypothetical protein
MTNIGCLTNYTEMERNHKNGLSFAKFSSKTTDWCQSMDASSGFKEKKQKLKITSTETKDQSLEQRIRAFLKSKHAQGEFICKRVAESMRQLWSVLPLAQEFMVLPGNTRRLKTHRTAKTCP